MKIEKSKEKGIKESGQSTLGHIIFKDPRLKNAFKERQKALNHPRFSSRVGF